MEIKMSDRFIRSRALFGDEAFEKLKNSRVAVFGLGGVGGYALEALARSGIGALDVIDPDDIDESNINRQLLALSSSVGQKKTQTAVKRLKEINPELIVSAHELFYSPENADAIDLKQFDAVADAIDFFPGKLELALRSRDAGVKLVSCMGTGKKTAPSLIRGFGHIRNVRVPFGAKNARRAEKKRRKRANGNLVARAARARAGLRTKLGRKKIHTERSSRAGGCGTVFGGRDNKISAQQIKAKLNPSVPVSCLFPLENPRNKVFYSLHF